MGIVLQFLRICMTFKAVFLVSDFAVDYCVQHYHNTEKQLFKHANEVISHFSSRFSFQVSCPEEEISK